MDIKKYYLVKSIYTLKRYTWLYLIILFSLNCDIKREALGADNEINVICSIEDKKIVEKYLSQIFVDTIFTPEPEPYYYLKFSEPIAYEDLKSKAYVIVAYADNSEENQGHLLIKKILPKEKLNDLENTNPMIFGKDVYAKKQLFMLLNLISEERSKKIVNEKKNFIRKKFHEQFILRQSNFILGEIRNKSLEKKIFSNYGVSMIIPWGWELIKDSPDSNFFWIGKEMPFQWIGVNWQKGNIVNNELEVGEYMWKWLSEYYGYIQVTDYKYKMDKTTFNENLAWRLKGVWETIDIKGSKGGPFNSYLFYDKNNDKSFLFNYLVHHPGRDKSIYMRQMDMIIKSIQVKKI